MQDISEEGYDRMRDRKLEQGTWRSASSDKPRSGGSQPKMKGKTVLQKQADKKYGAGTSAMDRVKADIIAKYGKGAIMNTKKEEVEQVDENRAAMGRINKEYHRKKEAEAMAARSRDPKVKRDLPKRKNDNPMYDPKSAGSSRVKGFKFTGEEVETIEEKRKGLWANIHAKRKRGEKPAKPGDKDYPKTLNVEGYDKPDEKLKTDRDMFNIPKEKQNAAKERLLAKAKAKRAKLKEETINERGDFWHPDPEKDRKLGGPGANQRAREDRAAASKPAAKKEDPKKLRKGESYMDYSKRQQASKKPRYSPELQKRIDAAKAKKKEGIVGKVMRKIGLKKEGTITYKEFIAEGNRTARMMQKSKTQVTGHISADRGSDEKKNREKRKGLEKDLKKHGIGHKKGVGEYKYDSGETGREVSYQTSKPDKMSKRRFGKVMRRLGRKHGQESVITKDKDKSAKLHYTEKGSKAKSDSIGKTKAGKHPDSYGETSGTKVRSGKLPKKTNKGAYHYG